MSEKIKKKNVKTQIQKRKNRKIKFSEKNYVEKYYMENGKAVIPVELEKIEDLYMTHDYKKMQLSDSVCAYVEEIAYMVQVNTDIVLEIHCPEIDDKWQDKVRKNIKNNYGMEIDECDFAINTNNIRSNVFLLVGMILIVINILVEDIGKFLPNFISVFWWVAIWDMIEMQVFENRDLKLKRLNYQQLYDSKITFVFDK